MMLRSTVKILILVCSGHIAYAQEGMSLSDMVASEGAYELARKAARNLPGTTAAPVLYEIDNARIDFLFSQGRDLEAGILRNRTYAENGVTSLSGALSVLTGNRARRQLIEDGINQVGKAVADQMISTTTITTSPTTTIEDEQSFPFRSSEANLHLSLAGQTTGLASSLGDARPIRSPDPELERVLATDPRSPFVTTVETPSGVSTGGFSGEEGLNIAGVLNVLAFDSGNLQDGDRVRLTVRDSRGVVLSRTITLTFGGSNAAVSVRRGLVNVTITALNEGTDPPNTGGLRVSGDVSGQRNGNFNLRTGQSGTLAVRVLGY